MPERAGWSGKLPDSVSATGDRLFEAITETAQSNFGPTRPPQDFKTIQTGQTNIQNQQIEFLRRQRRVRLTPVANAIGRVTRTAQGAREAIGKQRVVFGNEFPHSCSIKQNRAAKLPCL